MGPSRALGGWHLGVMRMIVVDMVRAGLGAADRWQSRHPIPAVAWAVNQKFGDDQAGIYVLALGWYGFTAIYPLLLVVVSILGYVGQASLGHSTITTLHKFPIIGQNFTPGRGSHQLHGSLIGLVIGTVGLAYGAQGVTQTAQQAMGRVWNIPQQERPGFLPRLGRSFVGLIFIGGAFLMTAAVGTYATAHSQPYALRVPVIAGLLMANTAFFLAAFRTLTPPLIPTRQLFPGIFLGAVGFTALTTIGTGLVTHELANKSATYGAFASVIGVVAFLLLLARISIYGAELNPVLHRHLWPRAFLGAPPRPADDEVLRARAHEVRSRSDERIGVGFHDDAAEEAAMDAKRP